MADRGILSDIHDDGESEIGKYETKTVSYK